MTVEEYGILANELSKKKREQRKKANSAFIQLKPLMGNFNWAEFLFLIGGAQAGKSYSVIDFFVSQFLRYGTPFYWFRLTERQSRQLLQNNAEKLIDPDIRRKYNLEIRTSGSNVYWVRVETIEKKKKNGDIITESKVIEKKLMCRVLALSTFYADKGSGYFDKDYKGWINVGMDEFQPEKNEKRTFDIVYAFVRQMENIARNRKTKVRVIGCANLLEEASDLLCCFNFIPEKFGIYKIKKKRCVIYYIEPNDKYKEMRKGSIADILLPNASMYSNIQKVDDALVYKGRVNTPQYVIKFDDDKMYTVWDNNIIRPWKGERKPIIPMLPYLSEVFNTDARDNIILTFDTRGFRYCDLITFKKFQQELQIIKPRQH